MQSEDLLEIHPGLVVVEANSNSSPDIILTGVLKVNAKWYHIHLSCPHSPALTHCVLKIQQRHIWRIFREEDIRRSHNWKTVTELINNLHMLLENDKNNNDRTTNILDGNNNQFDEDIYKEIAALHNPDLYDIHLNEAVTKIRFSEFFHHPQHYLEMSLPNLNVLSHSLPECLKWEENLEHGSSSKLSLSQILETFQKTLEDLSSFYECFTDIDQLCQVLQPVKPTTKHNWRLFVLKRRVFLKIIINDPFDPIGSKAVQIIGPTQEVDELRKMYSKGLNDWDFELNIHKNLLRIFDICYFPIAYSTTDDIECADAGKDIASSQEAHEWQKKICNICFDYEYNPEDENKEIEVPLISCDNLNCNVIFHPACLKQWFTSSADGKTFLDVAFGTCPFCKTKLSTSFIELLQTKVKDDDDNAMVVDDKK